MGFVTIKGISTPKDLEKSLTHGKSQLMLPEIIIITMVDSNYSYSVIILISSVLITL